MSLTFFKSNPEKTDATLKFISVLDNLNEKSVISTSSTALDIDQFIQQENINLRQHQEFYKETNNKDKVAPQLISKEDDITKEDTRTLVNTLIELSKTMPESKSTSLEYNDKIKEALEQNNHIISDINAINQSF